MRPLFREGEHVIVEFGIGDAQLGKVIAVSDHCETITVRLGNGIMGQGDLPLQWRSDSEYDLLAGGTVKVRKLPEIGSIAVPPPTYGGSAPRHSQDGIR